MPAKINEKDIKNDHESRIMRLEVIIENINATLLRLEKRIDNLEQRIDSNFKWLLGIMLGGFSGMLAVMANGFHWL